MSFLIELKNNFLKKENIYYFLIILTIFLLDRFSKSRVIKNSEDVPFFVNDYLNIDLIWNTGIGFGLLSSDSSIIYNLISILIVAIIFILLYFAFNSKSLDKIIYSMIIGGAFGNLYDRLSFNAVPDFIDLHYNQFHWFTFNVADIFITIGVVIFIMRGVFEKN